MRGGNDCTPAAAYDGVSRDALAARVGVPDLVLCAELGSTMDVAHARAAAGASDGTLVLADAQAGGRGRAGRAWASPPGTGVWLTVLARPADAAALDVLSLRVGIALADALAPLADGPVALKWPNDLLVGGRKLAGVLVEARWRDARVEWAAVGVGVNVRPPATFADAAALRPGVARLAALEAVVGAVRHACAAVGPLSDGELAALAARDAVRGRRILAPVAGRAAGVSAGGSLLVRAPDGRIHEVRQTTVTYAAEPPG